MQYLTLTRMIIASLPVTNTTILGIFDLGFNLIKKVLNQKDYYVGAFAMFGVTPGSLLMNSPLLAKTSAELYSFPGYPVSMKWIRFKVNNTTQNSEHSGRWAAVFIPYRETHDAKHYKEVIKDLTFAEVSAMPHAKTSTANKNITLQYRMRDVTSYCARPRELIEEIGLVYIIWDTSSREDYSSAITNSSFNCEIEVDGGCSPHIIFGPQHRITYAESDLKIRSITKGDSVRVHHEDGTVIHYNLNHDFEMA